MTPHTELVFSLHFHKEFYTLVSEILVGLESSHWATVHLRLENDMVNRWAAKARLDTRSYRMRLFKKYKDQIDKLGVTCLFVATGISSDHWTIDELKKDYKVVILDGKEWETKVKAKTGLMGREILGIVDFLVAKEAPGGCIGFSQSTMSQLLVGHAKRNHCPGIFVGP